MAGIGFELKKLFSRRGLFASFRAYGYAGIICTGPMLLGIVLLLEQQHMTSMKHIRLSSLRYCGLNVLPSISTPLSRFSSLNFDLIVSFL